MGVCQIGSLLVGGQEPSWGGGERPKSFSEVLKGIGPLSWTGTLLGRRGEPQVFFRGSGPHPGQGPSLGGERISSVCECLRDPRRVKGRHLVLRKNTPWQTQTQKPQTYVFFLTDQEHVYSPMRTILQGCILSIPKQGGVEGLSWEEEEFYPWQPEGKERPSSAGV